MNTINFVSVGLFGLVVLMAFSPAVSVPGHYKNVDYYHEPKYAYGYGVNDHYTGDIKTAHERRHGGWTEGSYSVLQPDGILRTVNYVADPVHGFKATVHNKGWSKHPQGHVHGKH